MTWRTRPLQLVLSGGPVTPTPIREYNGWRGENRGPFKGQQASASNPVMYTIISVYAPQSDHADAEMDNLYYELRPKITPESLQVLFKCDCPVLQSEFPYVAEMEGAFTSLTSNGSWCMGSKGEMSGTVCVTFTWYMGIYELFIPFVCFVVCSLL